MLVLKTLLRVATHGHSRSQRLPSFWSAPKIATSGKVQHRKSVTHGLPVNSARAQGQMCLVESTKRLVRAYSENWTFPEVAILGAGQNERGLWE